MLTIYEVLDMSPAGAGSSNGAMLGLDREYHAKLLGFNDLVKNTKDATWASDSFCSISIGLLYLQNALQNDRRSFGFM